MKYSRTPQFDADHRRLPPEHKRLFNECFPAFSEACDAFAKDGRAYIWPARFRVTPIVGRDGVWEMTWSFAGPDGRATFEFVRLGNEIRLRWRRIGAHSIYKRP